MRERNHVVHWSFERHLYVWKCSRVVKYIDTIVILIIRRVLKDHCLLRIWKMIFKYLDDQYLPTHVSLLYRSAWKKQRPDKSPLPGARIPVGPVTDSRSLSLHRVWLEATLSPQDALSPSLAPPEFPHVFGFLFVALFCLRWVIW